MQAVYVTTFQIHIRYTAGRGLLLKKGNAKMLWCMNYNMYTTGVLMTH